MLENLPPPPKDESKIPWIRDLLAYVWDGEHHIELGRGARRGDAKDHMLIMEIGAPAGATVELRLIGDFKPTVISFSAFVKDKGEEVPAGSAPLHEDGKGYRLTLARAVRDGEMVKLKSDGPLPSEDERRSRRKPKPALKRTAWQ